MSSLRRLPAELWLCVWDCLQPVDRLTASHVCRTWRAIALRARSLWTDVEFCARSRYAPAPGTRFDRNGYIVTSNLPLLRELLLRSRRLSLTVTIRMQFGTETIIPTLVAVLGPHARRIASLHHRGHSQKCYSLLTHLSGMTGLRELTTEGGMIPYEFTHCAPAATQLPALVHLELSEKTLLPQSPAVFLSLRSLSMTIPRLSYVARIVEACPSLRCLRINMRFVCRDDCLGRFTSEKHVLGLLCRVPDVFVIGATRDWAERLRASLCDLSFVERQNCASCATLGGRYSFTWAGRHALCPDLHIRSGK